MISKILRVLCVAALALAAAPPGASARLLPLSADALASHGDSGSALQQGGTEHAGAALSAVVSDHELPSDGSGSSALRSLLARRRGTAATVPAVRIRIVSTVLGLMS